jgi:hypothetical protein
MRKLANSRRGKDPGRAYGPQPCRNSDALQPARRSFANAPAREKFRGVLIHQRVARIESRQSYSLCGAAHLSRIRAIVRALANDANLREPEKFAQAKCSHRPLRDEGCRLGPIGDETGDANKPEFKVRAWRSFRLSVE